MKRIILTLIIGLATLGASAQGLKDIKINEILVKNHDSYADDYGHKVGWIELYNSGYSQVNIGAAYLRFVQAGDTITYRIPKNDVRTQIPPQGYVVFYCDGTSNKGTFYTNFVLDQQDSVKLAQSVGKLDSKIEFLDQSGKAVIDAIEYDVNTQTPDVSYGRHLNEDGEVVEAKLSHITPLQANDVIERTPKDEIFRTQDPVGIAMSITAMSVVFTALILLYLVFRTLGKYNQKGASKKEKATAASVPASEKPKIKVNEDIAGETVAAIAVALRKYEEDLHDIESAVLTINKVAKVYSPWSSKIYSMRQMPTKK